MAAVITDFGSDFGSDSSRSRTHYHRSSSRNMRAAAGHQGSPYRQTSTSRSRAEVPPSPRPQPIAAETPPNSTPSRAVEQEDGAMGKGGDGAVESKAEPPSPPLSSNSNSNQASFSQNRFTSQENFTKNETSEQSHYSDSEAARHMPSQTPAEAPFARPTRSLEDVKGYAGETITVRDLAHIQSFATEDFQARGKSGRRRAADDPALKYEISGMPITDIIEMVAGLLTKITTTNDLQHENLNRPLSLQRRSKHVGPLAQRARFP
ncbi:hypothetical protein LSUE1_G009016, partial [Lachnellula suecica]